ncbi:unnamed protein product, partial [Ectocarpus sp. 4 AP-2014]
FAGTIDSRDFPAQVILAQDHSFGPGIIEPAVSRSQQANAAGVLFPPRAWCASIDQKLEYRI